MAQATLTKKDAEAQAAGWFALAKAATKEGRRELLGAGAAYDVRLKITGTVGRKEFRERLEGKLTVGHDTIRATSSGPKTAELVARLLAELRPKAREKLLQTLPEEFERHGGQLSQQDSALMEAAEGLLKRLRARSEATSRGPVSCRYELGGQG